MKGGVIDKAAGHRPYWSGFMDRPEAEAEASPELVARYGRVPIIGSVGALTDRALLTLAKLVKSAAGDRSNRAIVLWLSSGCGQLAELWDVGDQVGRLSQRVPIVAYLEIGCGAALWLACRCRKVYASPRGQLGFIRCGFGDGEFDADVTAYLALSLLPHRPRKGRIDWPRLCSEMLNAEQAEAWGVIDGIVPNVQDLAQRYQTGEYRP